MGYVSAHEVIAVNPEMKERIENLGKYKKELISKIKLDDITNSRTYHKIDVRTNKNKDKEINNIEQTRVRKKVSFDKITKRTYAAIARTGDQDKRRNHINKRFNKDH